MIKSLKNAQIADGLPRILGEQPWVKALSMAMLELHQKTMGYIAGSQIYTAIDTVAEEVLDALEKNGLQILSTEQQEDWCRVTAALLET